MLAPSDENASLALFVESEMEINECEIMQTQSSNAFLYLCKNFTAKMIDFYTELFPFLCQLYKNEFQMTKISLAITVDESSSSTLKLLDAIQILFYYKSIHGTPANADSIEDFYQLVQPIYETLTSSLAADSLAVFIDYLDLCSNRTSPVNLVRYRRRNLMLSLHSLCLLLRHSKQQQQHLESVVRSKITVCLRPVLFDYVLKVTQFCNQLYDRQSNPHYDQLIPNLTYSETERQLYLGTYESNNVSKATIPSTWAMSWGESCRQAIFLSRTMPAGLPAGFTRSPSTTTVTIDDERLRDYLHRLFDICYQINGIYFAHDADLYYLKLNDETYFLTAFLQKILFENLNSLPSFRLRIVLRQLCRLFIEHYCSLDNQNKDAIHELFLSFLNVFFPFIQQRITTMWNNLSLTTNNYQQGQCSDEVIEECVCVLITRDFLDIIRYFLFKTATGGTVNSSTANAGKKKNRAANGREHSESMCEDISGDPEQTDEWDEPAANNGISNKLLNSAQEKMDYTDLFNYMIKMARQRKCRLTTLDGWKRRFDAPFSSLCLDAPVSLRLFTYVMQILFECLTYPDAYCVNRVLPIILPLTRLYTDIIEKHGNISSLVDIKALFQSLLKSFERHYENEGLNTNLISLIGHIYELWYQPHQEQLDLVLHQTIPQLNVELLTTYKSRLSVTNSKKPQPITERERRDTIKNLLNPLLLSPAAVPRKEGSHGTNPLQLAAVVKTLWNEK